MTARKKIMPFVVFCCIMFILLPLKSKGLKAHCRHVNSFASPFSLCFLLFYLEEDIASQTTEFPRMHLFPLPSIFYFTLKKANLFFVLMNTLLGLCVFNKVDASRNKMFLLNLEHHVFWDLLCMQEKSLIPPAPLLLLFYILVIRQCHAGYWYGSKMGGVNASC